MLCAYWGHLEFIPSEKDVMHVCNWTPNGTDTNGLLSGAKRYRFSVQMYCSTALKVGLAGNQSGKIGCLTWPFISAQKRQQLEPDETERALAESKLIENHRDAVQLVR